ncbi:MAG: hypothetical protein HYT39_02765 [Candidatus Sungbacteria bacterium]|nr:hypothetical protein [Candidatus Sungbacteria bacterium]
MITDLLFRPHGIGAGPGDGQAWITIVMAARSRDPRLGGDTAMNLETTISQRLREL